MAKRIGTHSKNSKTRQDMKVEIEEQVLWRTLKLQDKANRDEVSQELQDKIDEAIDIVNSPTGNVFLEMLMTIFNDIVNRKDEYIKEEYLYKTVTTSDGTERIKRKLFERERKLSFAALMAITLTYGDQSLKQEIMKFYNNDVDCPRPSALLNQLKLIKTDAFKDLFFRFTKEICKISGVLNKQYLGYWVLALDGSKIRIARNENDKETYVQSSDDSKGYNHLTLHAIYDVLNHIYVDLKLSPPTLIDERTACRELLETVSNQYHVDLDKTILVMDRGYDGIRQLAALTTSKMHFVVRTKDFFSRSSMLSKFKSNVQEYSECDMNFEIILTEDESKKCNPKYWVVDKNEIPQVQNGQEYKLKFRVVRIDLHPDAPMGEYKPSERYECLITDLSVDEMTFDQIKELYKLRWKIEESFLQLKVFCDLRTLHHKKRDYVEKEIWAMVTTFNYNSVTHNRTNTIWEGIEPLLPEDHKQHVNWHYNHVVNFTASVTNERKRLFTTLQARCLPSVYLAPIVDPIILSIRFRSAHKERDVNPSRHVHPQREIPFNKRRA